MASATSNPHTAGEKSRHVVCLSPERDQDDYIGDDVSHLEHWLQTAHQAKRAGSQDGVRLPFGPLCPKTTLPRLFLYP